MHQHLQKNWWSKSKVPVTLLSVFVSDLVRQAVKSIVLIDNYMWETTGGCAVADDDSLSTALRETREELGINLDTKKGKMWRRLTRHGSDGHTWFADVWIFEHECSIEEITLQECETTAAMWASTEKIQGMITAGEFLSEEWYPYFQEMIEEYS